MEGPRTPAFLMLGSHLVPPCQIFYSTAFRKVWKPPTFPQVSRAPSHPSWPSSLASAPELPDDLPFPTSLGMHSDKAICASTLPPLLWLCSCSHTPPHSLHSSHSTSLHCHDSSSCLPLGFCICCSCCLAWSLLIATSFIPSVHSGLCLASPLREAFSDLLHHSLSPHPVLVLFTALTITNVIFYVYMFLYRSLSPLLDC